MVDCLVFKQYQVGTEVRLHSLSINSISIFSWSFVLILCYATAAVGGRTKLFNLSTMD